jgi:predicted MPP superfamily phosphohydrolase
MFLAGFVSLALALHAYVWWRLAHGAGFGARFDAVTGIGFAAGALAVIGTLVARVRRRAVPDWIAIPAFVWLGTWFIGFGTALASEPLRLFLPARGVSVAGLAAVVLFLAWGLRTARRPAITRTTVEIPGLDPALSGLRIAQVSDLHVGNTVDRGFVARVVAAVNAESPDIGAVTGDLVDGTVEELRQAVAPLAGLRGRHGVFFVTGNHEYYAGVEPWLAHLAGFGWRILRNERVRVAGIDLAGVDDLFGRMAPGHGVDIDRALAGRDRSVPVVLLSHQPVTVDLAAPHGVALQLSGHTHGGQIFPFHLAVRTQQPALGGLVRHRSTALYVHRGTGYWGPPFRLGARGEIAILTLVPAG